MVVKPILGTVVGLQSVSLLGESMKTLPKYWTPKKMKMVKPKPLVKTAGTILVGTALISGTSQLINDL